jgi:Zn-dependent protease with chaperone function
MGRGDGVRGAREARGKTPRRSGARRARAIFGAAIAFIGFPGSFAAEAIKAAVSRQRELLADAASVQFTRNPDGIAGALDSIRYLKAGTTLRGLHGGALAHVLRARGRALVDLALASADRGAHPPRAPALPAGGLPAHAPRALPIATAASPCSTARATW